MTGPQFLQRLCQVGFVVAPLLFAVLPWYVIFLSLIWWFALWIGARGMDRIDAKASGIWVFQDQKGDRGADGNNG